MFRSSGRSMKWTSLLTGIKEKVGISSLSPSSTPTVSTSIQTVWALWDETSTFSTRENYELVLDFEKSWNLFRSSILEKEKEDALNNVVEIFCRLVRIEINVPELINMLVEPHLFAFVVGRTFVADIEKFMSSTETSSLCASFILHFLANVRKDNLNPRLNLLHTIQALSSGPVDKQHLLDSGLLSCLIHVLDALLTPDNTSDKPDVVVSEGGQSRIEDDNNTYDCELEVEGIIVHVLKALASHPSASASLTEGDSLHLLFSMVSNGSLTLFAQYRQGVIPLGMIQLHQQAIQILGLLLANDDGSMARYIHQHHLIKVLLIAVKDFTCETGDSQSTMSIVDLLLECVELSYRPGAGGVRLRDDIHNAHGYQFLVRLALMFSSAQKSQLDPVDCKLSSDDYIPSYESNVLCRVTKQNFHSNRDPSQSQLSLPLYQLLDSLVCLAQIGSTENNTIGEVSNFSNKKINEHYRQVAPEKQIRETESMKVKDLEAVQVLQDIFLKSDSVDLQAEVLNQMLKIFSSHIDNYRICQQLRIVPLFILNMAEFASILQEKILKILEYAVTVLNYAPEQELLSLCCLLQESITTELKHLILSFFIKLLSFDQRYQRVLREVGVLDVLVDDIEQNKFLSGREHQSMSSSIYHQSLSSNSFRRRKGGNDAILSSARLEEYGSGKSHVFEDNGTIDVAWGCLVYLLKKAEPNQSYFRTSNGVTLILPFLASDIHRTGVLRVLSCLIVEDGQQAHPEELGALIHILKSGMVTSIFTYQYKIHDDAKCDILGVIWRILSTNCSAQRVFKERAGFSLLFTMLHTIHPGAVNDDSHSYLKIQMKILYFLLHIMTAAICNNVVNRNSLHEIISSQAFCDLLIESGLICVDYEKEVVQLLLELALEILLPPTFDNNVFQVESDSSFQVVGSSSSQSLIYSLPEAYRTKNNQVYNGGAIVVLLRLLLLFTPKVQLDLLSFIENLARDGSFNQENLTSVGCVGLLLDIIRPFMLGSSPLLSHALKVVQALGKYRLSPPELQILVRYMLQSQLMAHGDHILGLMKVLVDLDENTSDNVPLAPFLEMNMSNTGHASVQVSLGERTWPPAAGYSFVCWFRFTKRRGHKKLHGMHSGMGISRVQSMGRHALRIFSVGTVEDVNSFYVELCLQDDGTFILATSNNCSVSFPDQYLEEDKWHHLAVVHSTPNALVGLFQSSVAHLYLNGSLRHTGKLGYSPSPLGKPLQVIIGNPISYAKVSELSWSLRCCYLFEDVLTSGSIFSMYILGRKYKGTFQDANLLRFVPNEACGGSSMDILDSLDADLSATPNNQWLDSLSKKGNFNDDRDGTLWDMERLSNLSSELFGKNLIFAFDGSSECVLISGTLSMLNLVDPMSAAASPIGGIPRYGRLLGDIFVCHQRTIGDSIHAIGGMTSILATIEASTTTEMLHMSLSLLASALYKSPQNVHSMQACRGYHLLALFLHHKMTFFDLQSLNIFFLIASCKASTCAIQKFQQAGRMSSDAVRDGFTSGMIKLQDEVSSVGYHAYVEDIVEKRDIFSTSSEVENADMLEKTSNSLILSNVHMVEHVLLDWTLWSAASVPIQVSLVGFFKHIVSANGYKQHNLAILRNINFVQRLLVTLQRIDIEVPVLEKLVALLGIILKDSFSFSELESVVRFVMMTFAPPELTQHHQVARETMGKHVVVRNMLLEMLLDMQMLRKSEEELEEWHKIVSSKLITYFLDEALHPTSMRWVMTILGALLSSSPVFALEFQSTGGFQVLSHVLRSFYDAPEIYYTLFCLLFGKSVYPRLPEVRMIDFYALIPNDLSNSKFKFVDLLESVIAMVKATFDRLSMQLLLACQAGGRSQVCASLIDELIEGTKDMGGELQAEALMYKTYAARLMGGDATAPVVATSVLRFMVDVVKMCRPFSSICRQPSFLKCCIDLYFSTVRAGCAVKMLISTQASLGKNNNDSDDMHNSQHTLSSLSHEQDQSAETYTSVESFPLGQASGSSEVLAGLGQTKSDDFRDHITNPNSGQQFSVSDEYVDGQSFVNGHHSRVFGSGVQLQDETHSSVQKTDSFASSVVTSGSSSLSKTYSMNITSLIQTPPTASLAPRFADVSYSDGRTQFDSTPSVRSSVSWNGMDSEQNPRSNLQGSLLGNMLFTVTPQLLWEIDHTASGEGLCVASSHAVIDFTAQVFADMVIQQINAVPVIEVILENVPLYVDTESALAFQGMCLQRLVDRLEKRLQFVDEDEKKLDKSCWSANLDTISCMIVDRVYMGAFPQPSGILRILEFLLSMLELSNKNGCIEEATPIGKGILSLKGSQQLEMYMHSLLRNSNRMIMYCFLPSFLSTIGEDDFLSRMGFQIEQRKSLLKCPAEDDTFRDICTVLQLCVAHQRLILCPINFDTDLICCLATNLIYLLQDQRQTAQVMSADLMKYLLLNRRATLEELFVSKSGQGQYLDVLNGGFDKLLNESTSSFYDWLQKSEQIINKVLKQCAAIMWTQYVAGSLKFPGVRIKGMEIRRKREMMRRSREVSKQDLKHFEQIKGRRYALELIREGMSKELRLLQHDKYGWVLHAESEWQSQLQELVHERGIFPIQSSVYMKHPNWQLCPIEGPYRMRKKLERCRLNVDTIEDVLIKFQDCRDEGFIHAEHANYVNDPEKCSLSNFHALSCVHKENDLEETEYDEPFFDEPKESDEDDISFVQVGQTNVLSGCKTEQSVHSSVDYAGKSSSFSVQIIENNAVSDMISSGQSFSSRKDESKGTNDMSEKRLYDNGEYLIRPYLGPSEKIRFCYNCERIVGLDKRDGIFLIGDVCLYVIENFYINDTGQICEKEYEDELSVIDQALGVNKDSSGISDLLTMSPAPCKMAAKTLVGGRTQAYTGVNCTKEKTCCSVNLPHPWKMWKLDDVHEILKRHYQLRSVAIEIFCMGGCNELLVFHKREREEVFKNLMAMNLPRNSMLDTTISGSFKQDNTEGSRLFKSMTKSFSKKWQDGEISNFQYLVHLNTLAGRGYNDLTQYPVFPWVLADYESDTLDLSDPRSYRKLDKPMGCQTAEGEEEFRQRYESWDDPDIHKFHYGSHYSTAGIVLFYLVRLPPFSMENQKLQGGKFDRADRLFSSIKDTWLSASGKGNTSDVRELIPEFFYMPEFLENRCNFDFGETQSGDKVNDVTLPPWAKGSAREFIRKHREALESEYVSQNLHHWIDLIFGYKQRGEAAEEAVNVFHHYTYDGSVDIDDVSDPTMKASILAQINHFGQTPRQLFLKPHVKRHADWKPPMCVLHLSNNLVPDELRKMGSPISQIVVFNEKILVSGLNILFIPVSYRKCISWGYPDRSLRIISYDQDRLLSCHENLHQENQLRCAGVSHDGHTLVTGGDDGVVSVWQINEIETSGHHQLQLKGSLCAHKSKVTCVFVSQPYKLLLSGSEDCSVLIWDLNSLRFVRELAEFRAPVSVVYVNDFTGELITAAGNLLAVWSINGDCLATVNTSQIASDSITSVTSSIHSDWLETNWFISGHQSGVVKIWRMIHWSDVNSGSSIPVENKSSTEDNVSGRALGLHEDPEYRLVLNRVLRAHKDPVTAMLLTPDLKQLLTGDSSGLLLSWTLPDDGARNSSGRNGE